APGECGMYLGLTGEAMTAADAIYAGFSDLFFPAAKIAGLVERMASPAGGAIDDMLNAAKEDPGRGLLQQRRNEIDRAFAGESVEAIVAALSRSNEEWARTTVTALAQKSPKALKLTHAAIRNARSLASLEQALNVEFRLTVRLFEDGE